METQIWTAYHLRMRICELTRAATYGERRPLIGGKARDSVGAS